MNAQLDILVDVPRSRKKDPETSHLAGEKIGKDLPRQQKLVLEWVRKFPGSTSAELANYYADGFHWMEAHGLFRRRLPELRGVRVRNGEARICSVTRNKCLTWMPI